MRGRDLSILSAKEEKSKGKGFAEGRMAMREKLVFGGGLRILPGGEKKKKKGGIIST